MKQILWIIVVFWGSILKALPQSLFLTLGRSLGAFLQFIGFRKNIIDSNLQLALGHEISSTEMKELKRKHYRHLGIVFLEIIRNCAIKPDESSNYIEVKGYENIEKAKQKGKGVLILCGHYGNWELALRGLAQYTAFKVTVKKVKNSFAQFITEKQRVDFGIGVLYANDSVTALKEMLRASKNQEICVFILDQHAPGDAGVRVDFFGTPARASKGLASLVLKTKMPVLSANIIRQENGHNILEFSPELPFFEPEEKSKEAIDTSIFVNTQNYTKYIENNIRKTPEQWLWIHRRWKCEREPLAEKDLASYKTFLERQ